MLSGSEEVACSFHMNQLLTILQRHFSKKTLQVRFILCDSISDSSSCNVIHITLCVGFTYRSRATGESMPRIQWDRLARSISRPDTP